MQDFDKVCLPIYVCISASAIAWEWDDILRILYAYAHMKFIRTAKH